MSDVLRRQCLDSHDMEKDEIDILKEKRQME